MFIKAEKSTIPTLVAAIVLAAGALFQTTSVVAGTSSNAETMADAPSSVHRFDDALAIMTGASQSSVGTADGQTDA